MADMPDRIIRDQGRRSLTLRDLSDAGERGWWRLTTAVDDYGRFPADPGVLLHRLMEYDTLPAGWTRIRMAKITEEWERAGLVHLYQNGADARLYGHILTFLEHQRERDSKPKYPEPPCLGKPELAAKCRESRQVAARAKGDIGPSALESRESRVESRDNTSRLGGGLPQAALSAPWGTPEALVKLYNELTPDECPAVETLSPARRAKARTYLAMFPEREFWQRMCGEIGKSRFLRGLLKSEGHAHFVASFDWLLTKGKDGTENVVKTVEGRYRDGA